jgi:cob(I)alamin adenosyltransferase
MEKRKGLVQIYTGDGKGKTTAAIGQAVRAAGNDFKICFAFFFKDFEKYPSGEKQILEKLGIKIFTVVEEYPWHKGKVDVDKMRKECLKALDFIKDKIYSEDYDLLVLDEINITIRDKFLLESEIVDLIRNKPAKLELILTGRGATDTIFKEANLVSRIEKVKHPFDDGIPQRIGIEF